MFFKIIYVYVRKGDIAIFNLNMDLSSSKYRLLFLGFNGTLTAIFSFIGPNLASFLMGQLKDSTIHIFGWLVNGYQIVFWISGILQIIVIYLFIQYLIKAKLGEKQ